MKKSNDSKCLLILKKIKKFQEMKDAMQQAKSLKIVVVPYK